jgi:hypothetical protein
MSYLGDWEVEETRKSLLIDRKCASIVILT